MSGLHRPLLQYVRPNSNLSYHSLSGGCIMLMNLVYSIVLIENSMAGLGSWNMYMYNLARITPPPCPPPPPPPHILLSSRLVLNIHPSGVLTALVVTWLVPRKPAAVSAPSVYTIQSCILSRHFMQRHTRRVHVYLAVTCQLHFWQNDRDLLRATVVTRELNGYRS